MAKPKKHHFVPRFLLKNFASGKKNKAKLWTFDKKTGRSYFSSVRDTAHENLFYESANLDNESIEAEDLTAFSDDVAAPAVREVVANKQLALNGKQFVSLSYFIATQSLRVPYERELPHLFSAEDNREMGTANHL